MSGAKWSLVMLATLACNEPAAPEQKASPLPAATPQVASSSPTPAAPPQTPPSQGSEMKITWDAPKEWSGGINDTGMQKARYSIPASGSDDKGALVTVTYFGPDQGGTVDANIERWINQFSDVKKTEIVRSNRTVNDLLQHVLEIPKGNYASGMPGAPPQANKDYALLAAIVETSSGKYFFKMIGPRATVAANKAEFNKLLESIKHLP